MRSSFPGLFKQTVEKYPVLALFRHQYPDPDAWGSQHGLALWLKQEYPDKTVIEASAENEIPEEEKKEALAIILDTSNSPRIEGESWKDAAETLRIDHHVRVEEIGRPELDEVDEKAAATCELVPLTLKALNASISQEAANSLMKGLMADTQRFTISSVRPETFEAAAWLVEQNADLVKCTEELFCNPYERFEYGVKVRQKACLKNGVLFSVMDTDDYLSLGMGFTQAKEFVDELNNVEEAQIWALFTRMDDGIHYAASLRSRHLTIRTIAAEYGGGGHDKAAGIKNLTAVQVKEIIDKLRELTA